MIEQHPDTQVSVNVAIPFEPILKCAALYYLRTNPRAFKFWGFDAGDEDLDYGWQEIEADTAVEDFLETLERHINVKDCPQFRITGDGWSFDVWDTTVESERTRIDLRAYPDAKPCWDWLPEGWEDSIISWTVTRFGNPRVSIGDQPWRI